jgi:hypothetical protein
MKTFLYLLASLISLTAYSQAFIYHSNTIDGTEMHNPVLKKLSIISNPCYFNPVDLTEYSYDTVRELTEINTPYADAHPWISPDGLRLYYTSDFYINQLVVTERADINSYFGTPTILPIPNNWGVSYWLSADELDLYFADGWYDNLWYSHRNATDLPFSTPWPLDLIGIGEPDYISAQSLNSEQTELFVHIYEGDSSKILQFSILDWLLFHYERTLPAPPGFSLIGGQLSRDDLTYFTGAKDTAGKYNLYQMTRATPSDTFDISTFQLIDGINDTSVFNVFPSMSDNLEWVAFNRAPTGNWEDIDLYLAHDGILTSVFNPADLPAQAIPYPVPASESVNIRLCSPPGFQATLAVYSLDGELIQESRLNPSERLIRLNTSHWNDGFYVYQLSIPDGKSYSRVTGRLIILH